jgi:dynein heavy chain 2
MFRESWVSCSSYPDRDQLQAIYASYLTPVLSRQLTKHPVWSSASKINALASTMVQVYEQIRAKFTVDDYGHYLFTPRDLTKWVLSLLRYDLASGANENTSDQVLEIMCYEAHRLFRDRIVGQEGIQRFDSTLMSVVRSDWSGNIFDALQSKQV